jgi:hypothetical protein
MHIEDVHNKDAQPCRFAEPNGEIFAVRQAGQFALMCRGAARNCEIAGKQQGRACHRGGRPCPVLSKGTYFSRCAEIPVVAVAAVTVTMVADFPVDLCFHHCVRYPVAPQPELNCTR